MADETSTDPGYGIAAPGYRLPAGAHIGRVRLQVADLARSLDYYQRVLGFRVLEQHPGEAVLAAHGDDTPLIALRERPNALSVPPSGLLGLYHFAILLPDRAALGRFIVHLAGLGVRAGMADHSVSEAVYLTDPDGLGIEVYADRPRHTWRSAPGGRELHIDTRPLDVRDLVQSSGGERWRGMPAGTRIGHVHLHVGDLDAASAFYHEALGLDRMAWTYPGALFLSAGGYHHHLGTNTWAGAAPRPSPDDAQLLEWEIVVPEDAVREIAASLERAGFAAAPDGADLVVRDPWGTTVRVRGVPGERR